LKYDIDDALAKSSFNGAVTFSLRKSLDQFFVFCHGPKLQWGRNFFVTEISRKPTNLLVVLLLQWGRNFFVTEISTTADAVTIDYTLQWGRNFFVTEIYTAR